MSWLVPLPVALPLLMAAVLVALTPICRRGVADSIGILTAGTGTVICGLLLFQSAHNTTVYWFGDWTPRGNAAIGISFVIDPLGAGLAGLVSLLVTLALIFSWRYFEAVRTYYHVLMLLFLGAMAGFSLTGDLFNLFVFFELMSVAAYALTGYKVEEIQALEGSINFAVTNSVGAFLVLVGISLLYGRTGALNLAQVGDVLSHQPADGLVLTALTLILGGFFVKAAVVPFHFWLADAHAVAPTPVCVLFSGVMVELGLYGAFRVYHTVFEGALGPAGPSVRLVLMSFGALTALLGAVMCYAQRHIKRLLAFSTISHVGIMLAGFGTFVNRGTAGAAMYLLGHAFVKGALFMSAGLLLNRFSSLDEHELCGKGRRMPVLTFITILGGLGLAGFPPFGTYLGKQLIEEAAAKVHQDWLTWLFLLTSVLTGGAVLRVAGTVFFSKAPAGGRENHSATASREQPETRGGRRKPPVIMLTAAVLMVIIPALSGVFGDALATSVQAASERFNDRPLYLTSVLDAQASGPVVAHETVKPSVKGIAMGVSAALGATLLALLEFLRARIPDLVQRAWRAGPARVVGFLQRIQSGHVGDYIVWLVVGVVVLGAAFIIAGKGG